MPTLYDNFSQVKQYIDQEKPDLTSYVTKTELANCGYITANDISGKADKSELNSYLSVSNFVKPEGVNNLQLLESGLIINNQGKIYTNWFSYNQVVTGGNYTWVGSGTLKNYVSGRLAEIEASYVTTSDLNGYLPLEGGEITGPLYNSYYTTNNAQYGIKSYSHIIAGDPDRTTVTFIATQRKCGGVEGTTYMASFFTNSDGRSKFAHKSYTGTKSHIGGEADDAFMCFNAYGFKIAYSGTQGTSASTEYDIIHSGNIQSFIPVIDENIIPKENNTYTLGDATYYYSNTYTKNIILSNGYNWIKNISNTQIDFGVNQYNRARLTNTEFCPSTNNGIKLGTSTNQWNRTYTGYLYLNGTNIIDSINGMFSYDSTTGTLTITTIS